MWHSPLCAESSSEHQQFLDKTLHLSMEICNSFDLQLHEWPEGERGHLSHQCFVNPMCHFIGSDPTRTWPQHCWLKWSLQINSPFCHLMMYGNALPPYICPAEEAAQLVCSTVPLSSNLQGLLHFLSFFLSIHNTLERRSTLVSEIRDIQRRVEHNKAGGGDRRRIHLSRGCNFSNMWSEKPASDSHWG